MPGITKRKFNGELIRFNKHLKQPLNKIYEILPCEYNENILLQYFKELYPFEWKIIKQRYEHYQSKDEFLVKHGKKRRYKHLSPKKYFFNLAKVRDILSKIQRKKDQYKIK